MLACDEENGDIDVLAGEDPEFRGGPQDMYRLALAHLVRIRAAEQGITPIEEPPEVRPELVELGRALAFDKILSGNHDISCMTCHHSILNTDDDLNLSIGVGGVGLGTDRVHPDGIFIPRNAPPLFNLHAMETMFWDGRVTFHGQIDTPADEELTQEMLDVFEFGAVSAQAMFPVTSRAEMRGKIGTNELSLIRDDDFTGMWAALMNRLGQVPEYVQMFEAAYPGTNFEDMSFAHAANAIAGFEIAAFAATESPWDEFLRGDNGALTIDELQGANHFLGKANCSACHSGSALTDEQFHNTALAQFGPGKNNGVTLSDDWGRFLVNHDTSEFYRFRTAPLRNVALTGPWGHAGQYDDLAAFIEHYIDPVDSLLNFDAAAEGVHPDLVPTLLPNQEAILRHLSPILAEIDLKEQRIDEVVAFLEALTDPASLDLLHTIPESVPSGLPVTDDVLVVPDNYAGQVTGRWLLPGSTWREYQIQEPSMCDEDGGGTATITFDRNANTLVIDSQIKGLPYRPTKCFEYDPSTQWNQYPDCVEDGHWQMWIVPRMFNVFVPFWYDALTGDLIASDWELDGPPPNAFPVTLPAVQMIESPLFEPDPNTLIADFHLELEYDHMLDARGTAGALVTILPKNIFNPTDVDVYYSEGGLPVEYAMNWQDMIEHNAEGKGGFALVVSLEPEVKPEYLWSRDNVMLGYAVQWPEPNPQFQIPAEEPCGTDFQWDGVQIGGAAP